MPVDEAVLEQSCKDIKSALVENYKQGRVIKALLVDAEDISLVDIPDPTAEEPQRTKKVIPKDRKLGKEISPARRNEVYDAVMEKKASLGI